MNAKLYFQMAEIAPHVGRSTEATQKWLRRQGAAKKVGGRWVITAGKLLATLPEVFQKLTGVNRTEPDRTGHPLEV